jgi:hypothetical protein
MREPLDAKAGYDEVESVLMVSPDDMPMGPE